MPSYLSKTYIIYMRVCNKVHVSKMRCSGDEDYFVGGRWAFLPSKTSEPEQREPPQPHSDSSGGVVAQRQLWLAWVEPAGTMSSHTWTEAIPRELVPGKLWGDMKGWGTGASECPQPLALKSAGQTGTHLQSYRDELGTPEVTEAHRETPEKYLKGVKKCSCKKATEQKVHLMCLHTNAHSTGNEKKLEVTKCCWKIMPASWAAAKTTEPWGSGRGFCTSSPLLCDPTGSTLGASAL